MINALLLRIWLASKSLQIHLMSMVTTLDRPRKCNILSSTSLPQHQWLARPSSFPTLETVTGNNHEKVDLQMSSPTFPYFWASSGYFFPLIFWYMYFFLRISFGGIKIRFAPSASPGGGRTLPRHHGAFQPWVNSRGSGDSLQKSIPGTCLSSSLEGLEASKRRPVFHSKLRVKYGSR